MSEPKKRKLEADDHALVEIKVKGDGTAAAEINSKFNLFPAGILSTISTQLQAPYTTVAQHVHPNSVNAPSGPTVIAWQVWTTEWDRQTAQPSPPVCTLVQQYKSQGLANLAAMQRFMDETSNELKHEKTEWVELVHAKLPRRCPNPTFNNLHQLRLGDLGWGFDEVGSISLSVHRQGWVAISEFSVHVQVDIRWS